MALTVKETYDSKCLPLLKINFSFQNLLVLGSLNWVEHKTFFEKEQMIKTTICYVLINIYGKYQKAF